jgi:predicted O-methyltransferase YrrM
VEYEEVAEKLRGIPFMSPEQGRTIYDHVRAERPTDVLEIGTANAVGTSYIAAALAANGEGRITTVDRESASYEPGPEAVLAAVGLGDRVERVRNPDSSYNWWLKDQVAARSDAAGNTEPVYDFVFLDGAHELTIDGLAVVLIEKLLKPGGWLLLDDLDWTYDTSPHFRAHPEDLPPGLSPAERREPHLQAVFDVVIKPHPAFAELREEAGWGWAKKDPGAPRRLDLVVETRSLSVARRAQAKLRSLRG